MTKQLPGMCILNTPVEDHTREFSLFVKREDLCCPAGPHFSKCRGVYAHIKKRSEKVIGCLDTSHSQGGWATAQACKLLGKHAVVYYPVRKGDRIPETVRDWDPLGRGQWGDVLREPQIEAQKVGAALVPLAAGRSAILYHQAKNDLYNETGDGPYNGYMMPNALKLDETVTETAAEFQRTKLPDVNTILVSASSATIAAGVWAGALQSGWQGRLIVHMGYERPKQAVLSYMNSKIQALGLKTMFNTSPDHIRAHVSLFVIDEGYGYADEAKDGITPPWPCNKFYDLKAFRWWLNVGRKECKGNALFWNVG